TTPNVVPLLPFCVAVSRVRWRRNPNSLKRIFTIYHAEGSVDVSYECILPDLFCEGQGVVVKGELEKGNHILGEEGLEKRGEGDTPR
ncbi:cytochrome c maturation protein CcmE, partial [Escherichia coli]